MTWTTLSLQVTTPLFNGGASETGQPGDSPADDTGIRVASLRGAMRFWFRALAGSVIGPDLNGLSAAEAMVFGSTEHTSPVVLRIAKQPAVVPAGAPRTFLSELTDPDTDPRWLVYLLGQSLADMRSGKILRPYVAPGESIELRIGFRHHGGDAGTRQVIESLTYASLWLTCAYGGVGARTRRGFGGLRITAADGALAGPWTASTLVAPPLAHYESLRHLWRDGPIETCAPDVERLAGRSGGGWNGRPAYPVLSPTYTPARTGGRTYPTWQEALVDAGSLLRSFRADVVNENPRARYDPKIETREWAEVVHRGDQRFQLGGLGLPVVYRRDANVNVVKTTGSRDVLRRASPLWIRPVGEQKRWRLLSFAFNAEFLPAAAHAQVELAHENRRRPLAVTDLDVQDVTEHWINAMAADDEPVRPPTRRA
jgi:CRISPR type III-B/RAMP module RAMP protein Cmr1